MQDDGNLVVYDRSSVKKWASFDEDPTLKQIAKYYLKNFVRNVVRNVTTFATSWFQ